jgi:hypothetical protein
MIVRVLTARVPAKSAAQFESLLREQLPKMREHDGLIYLKLARQVKLDYEDVLLFEEWRDAKSLYEWAGPRLLRPRLFPGAERLVERVEVTHYEALDVDPDELFALSTSVVDADEEPANDNGTNAQDNP